MMKTITAAMIVLAASGVWGARPEAGTSSGGSNVPLGKQYTDAINGFSLRAPADCERRRETSGAKLVSWACRDSKTGAIAWSLSVMRAVEGHKTIDVNAYAKALAEKLARDEQYKIESTTVHTMAGKAAITYSGVVGSTLQMYKKQAWVLTQPSVFLIFSITGPVDAKADLERTFDTILATLELVDPTKALQERKDNLLRGQELLSKITDTKLDAVLIREPQWFLLTLKDKEVGWMIQKEAPASQMELKGAEVTTWVAINVPNQSGRVLKRVLFTTPDGMSERWKEQLQEEASGRTTIRAEDGLKQQNVIVCKIDMNGKVDTQKKMVPDRIFVPGSVEAMKVKIYLPRAMSYLLGRLADPDKPARYSFATYNSETNNFDMCTFAIEGREKISLAGREVAAVRATQKTSEDADPVAIWLDEKGAILRVQSPEGLLLEASTRDAVMRRYPHAEETVTATARWASQP